MNLSARTLCASGCALGLLLVGSSQVQAAVVFGSATLSARSYDIIGDSSYNIDRFDVDSETIPAPGFLDVSAASGTNTNLNTGPPGRPYLESSSSMQVSTQFTDADRLEFRFAANFSQSLAPSSLLSFALSQPSTQLTYVFSLDSAMDLNLSQQLDAGEGHFGDITVRQFFDDGSTADIFSVGSRSVAFMPTSTLLGPGNYNLFLSNLLTSSIAATAGQIASGAASGRYIVGFSAPVAGPVPEPAAWVMLIAGFALVGMACRRDRPYLPRPQSPRAVMPR